MNDFAGLRGPRGVNWEGGNPNIGYGMANYAPDSMNVLFYLRPVKNEVASKEQNRPIHTNIDFIRMQVPGESSTVIDRPAREDDKQRFPDKWNRYIHDKTQVPEGTPIELLYVNNPAMGENMKAFGVFTVEQCANLSAHAMTSIGMGAQEAQTKARAYLESATKGSNFLKLERDFKELAQSNRMLQQNFDSLQAQHRALIEKLSNPNKTSDQPAWQPGYDAQAERLNSNHPSKELARKKSKAMPTAEESENATD